MRAMRLVLYPLLAILSPLLLLGGRLGMLKGRPPAGPRVTDGQLRPPRALNSVSSQAELHAGSTSYHRIAPLPYEGDARSAWGRLKDVIGGMNGARIVDEKDGYLRAEFTSRALNFVDDLECLLDEKAGVVHVRSASRLGKKDFGVNRKRVEAIRALFAKG
jgi:uncharacterized protein (DUF1499 family)